MAFVTLLDGKANYAFYYENTTGPMKLPGDMPYTLSNDIEALFFGGMSLAIKPCAAAYVVFPNKNKELRLIMADPNLPPAVISNKIRYRSNIFEVSANCDILNFN